MIDIKFEVCDECYCCKYYVKNNDYYTCYGQETPCHELWLDEEKYMKMKDGEQR